MSVTTIMIEPGRNYYSKHTVRNTAGTAYECEFFFDIVYKLIKIFEDTDIQIVDPSWASKYPTMNERVEYLNGLSENAYDMLICLRLADETNVQHVYPQNNQQSIDMATRWTKTDKTKSNDVMHYNNHHKILYATKHPAIVAEVCTTAESSMYLNSQECRSDFAYLIAKKIKALAKSSAKLNTTVLPRIVNSGIGCILADGVVVRRNPMKRSDILCKLNEGCTVELADHDWHNKDWMRIAYGPDIAYINRNLVRVEYRKERTVLNTEDERILIDLPENNTPPTRLGVVKTLFSKIYSAETKTLCAICFRDTTFAIYHTDAEFATISFGGKLAYIPMKNITLYNDVKDKKDYNGTRITAEELARLGYTQILL